MRTAVYSGTRNLYPDMVTAAKSLTRNSDVEKIYFLIEDDTFPEKLPPHIETVNVSGQKWFPKTGANYRTSFTYMSLLRVCYTKLFPELDKVLQLDVDTLAVDDVSALWDVDLTEKWYAAVEEALSTYKPYGPKYYNIGVAVFNLEQIRREHADDQAINFLNTHQVPYIDQDAWSRFWRRGVDLPTRYNESFVTGYTEEPAIIHFAGIKDWQNSPKAPRREYLKKYREMSWEEALRGKNPHCRSDV